MIYEVMNPSDPVTIEAEDELVACVVTLVTGEGKMGLTNEGGETVLPLFLFGGADEWMKEKGLDGDGFQRFVDEHRASIVACFRSAAVADINDRRALIAALSTDTDPSEALRRYNEERRTSMNDICGWMHAAADQMEAAAS